MELSVKLYYLLIIMNLTDNSLIFSNLINLAGFNKLLILQSFNFFYKVGGATISRSVISEK